MEIATFAAGCFWGVEAQFRDMTGVTGTRVGYIGGETEAPTYEQVCRGHSGHAEAVEVRFDPAQVSFHQLVEAFFALHNPTQLNRQGPDVGAQYRSAIFTHSDAQSTMANEVREAVTESARHAGPVVTEIESAPRFWPAEDYHQKYLEKRGLATCRTLTHDVA